MRGISRMLPHPPSCASPLGRLGHTATKQSTGLFRFTRRPVERPIPVNAVNRWKALCQDRSASARGGLRPGSIPSHFMERKKRPMASFRSMERMRGIEPPTSAWEADILPLNYIRVEWFLPNYTTFIAPSQDVVWIILPAFPVLVLFAAERLPVP